MQRPPAPSFHPGRRQALFALAGTAAALAGCGGGGGGAGTGGIGTGSSTGTLASGPIAGLGSVIVQGIRFDDSTATLLRDDDSSAQGLKLGMVVALEGSVAAPAAGIDALPTATASRIVYASEWVGPVESVSTLAGSLQVLGQTVTVSASTVYEGAAAQLSALGTTMRVEVYGFLDAANGRLAATRIESSLTQPSRYRLTGVVSQRNAVAGTFRLGPTTVRLSAGAQVPAAWGDGSLVRVTLQTTPSGGEWLATRVALRPGAFERLDVRDQARADIRGIVTAYTSALRFSVDGIPVDASRATASGTVTLGARVEVEGTTASGTVLATQVRVEDLAGGAGSGGDDKFDFFGTVSALDTSARSFQLRGLLFTYPPGTPVQVAGWVTGATPLVRVRASQVNGAWVASEIRPGS